MIMKEKAREAFWARRSKVFQAHQGTCYVMTHMCSLVRRRRMNIWSMNPYSPPNSGGAKKKRRRSSLKLAEEIIVRAKRDAREGKDQTRSFPKKMWAGLLLATFPLFSHPCFLSCIFLLATSLSVTISELFYSASFIGWNHSKLVFDL